MPSAWLGGLEMREEDGKSSKGRPRPSWACLEQGGPIRHVSGGGGEHGVGSEHEGGSTEVWIDPTTQWRYRDF